MGNLLFLYSKLKDLWELEEPLGKFEEISMFGFKDIWDQSFHEFPYMEVLCPYKGMDKTSNWNISKTG